MLWSGTPTAVPGAPGADLRFVLPIAGQAFADWTVSEYFDADPAPGAAVDYAGGTRTYDGHNGIDFALAHFDAMDAGVDVLAAAAGTVIAVHDGEFDRQTAWLDPQPASNYVVIDHGHGWVTRYLHLRNGSLDVAVGDLVNAGQPVARVGSSGKSSGPHLHFEAQLDGAPIDLNAPEHQAMWATSLPYVDGVAGLLDAGLAAADPHGSLQRDERPAELSGPVVLAAGQTRRVHLWFMPVGVDAADALAVTWTGPDGSTYWTQTYDAPSPDSKWFTAWIDAPAPVPGSESPVSWSAAITLNGQVLGRRSVVIQGPASSPPEGLPTPEPSPAPGEAAGPRLRVGLAGEASASGMLTGLHAGQLRRGRRKARAIVLGNGGDQVLRVRVTPPGGGLFVLAGSRGKPVVVQLDPGQSRTLVVRAVARKAGGLADRLVLRSNDAEASRWVIALRGRVAASGQAIPADAARWWVRTDEKPWWEAIIEPTQNHVVAQAV